MILQQYWLGLEWRTLLHLAVGTGLPVYSLHGKVYLFVTPPKVLTIFLEPGQNILWSNQKVPQHIRQKGGTERNNAHTDNEYISKLFLVWPVNFLDPGEVLR